MVDFIKDWITAIVTTVIFITIVEMILPEGNIKKYTKIATGLLIMVVILSPIFKLVTGDIGIEKTIGLYSSAISSYDKVDKKEAQKRFEKITKEAFKENLKKNIQVEVKKKTGKDYIITDIKLKEASKEFEYAGVRYIEIKKKVKDSKIVPVEVVEINKNEKSEDEGHRDNEVLKVLKDDFDISGTEVKFIR